MNVYVIPTKAGLWRVARMTPERYARWSLRWRRWWATVGRRLAVSPEMWVE